MGRCANFKQHGKPCKGRCTMEQSKTTGCTFTSGIWECVYSKRGAKPDENTPAPILWSAKIRVNLANKTAYTPQDVASILTQFSASSVAVQARSFGAGLHAFENCEKFLAAFARKDAETKKMLALEKRKAEMRKAREQFLASIADLPTEYRNKVIAGYDIANPIG